jgi:serine/threonine protein kinase
MSVLTQFFLRQISCFIQLGRLMNNYHTLPIGTRLKNGEYEIVSQLGQGGFGITYRAVQTALGRSVAVKEFYLDGRCVRSADGLRIQLQSLSEGDFEVFKSRFYDEAKMLDRFGKLPGIVNVIDFFRENNTVYYVMEFVEGLTLHQYLLCQPQERMEPANAAELIRKIAVSLVPVHAQNVLHRDLKPTNIIIKHNGEPVVLDFGAAREFISDKTALHSLILSPGYAPPEQYNASGKFGPTIDIYALGAMLYRMLTGKTPPASPSLADDMPKPYQLNPSVPIGLSSIVLKAMAPKSADRYQTLDELRLALYPYSINAQATVTAPINHNKEPDSPKNNLKAKLSPIKNRVLPKSKKDDDWGCLPYIFILVIGGIFFYMIDSPKAFRLFLGTFIFVSLRRVLFR